MAVRATEIGITSFEFSTDGDGTVESEFITWVFTRNPEHCRSLEGTVNGCSVVLESDVPRHAYLTYCERMYMNPLTGTGPHWDDLLPARLFAIKLDQFVLTNPKANTSPLFASIRLPEKVPIESRLSPD